jgi:hypothetical protein
MTPPCLQRGGSKIIRNHAETFNQTALLNKVVLSSAASSPTASKLAFVNFPRFGCVWGGVQFAIFFFFGERFRGYHGFDYEDCLI